jgi:pimeloyl-ACP methyl ester carboxylesterase
VLVHGFACAHDDWDAQVAHLAPHHQTVVVDLRGHGKSGGSPDDCSIENHAADVVEVVRSLALRPAVLVGHSMGCRVVIEAALQAPDRVSGVVLVDGSQFASAMADVLRQAFASPDGFVPLAERMFRDMFTAKSDAARAAAVIERAMRMPRKIGETMLLDLPRYDANHLTTNLAALRVPVLAIQATYANEQRQRRSLDEGETTPFLEMLRSSVPSLRTEIIADSGHFPQIDEPAQVNALLEGFIASLPAR